MIFLYRFELIEFDGALSSVLPPASINADSGARRTVHLLTSYEKPVTTHGAAFKNLFLPTVGGASSALTFQPAAVHHDGLRWDGEKSSGHIRVSLPLDHPLAAVFKSDAPAAEAWLTLAILRNNVVTTLFYGKLTAADFDEHRCQWTAVHLRTLLEMPALTRRHTRHCSHGLFSKECGVKAHALDTSTSYFAHREDTLITYIASNRTVIRAERAARAPGWCAGGRVVIGGRYSNDASTAEGTAFYPREAGGLTTEQAEAAQIHGGVGRTVVADNENGDIELMTALPPGVAVGDRITIYAGCAKTREAHLQFFPNMRTFGGYPFMPAKHPSTAGLK